MVAFEEVHAFGLVPRKALRDGEIFGGGVGIGESDGAGVEVDGLPGGVSKGLVVG